jgi:hypothetical protein
MPRNVSQGVPAAAPRSSDPGANRTVMPSAAIRSTPLVFASRRIVPGGITISHEARTSVSSAVTTSCGSREAARAAPPPTPTPTPGPAVSTTASPASHTRRRLDRTPNTRIPGNRIGFTPGR